MYCVWFVIHGMYISPGKRIKCVDFNMILGKIQYENRSKNIMFQILCKLNK